MTHSCTSPYRKRLSTMQSPICKTVCSRFTCGSVKTDSSSTRKNLKRCSCQLHSMQDHRPSSLTDMNVAGCIVPLTDTVKLLGVTIDRHLTFDAHVQNVCKSAFYHIRALKHIRSSLSTDMAKTVAAALVNSRLDYANSVLYNTSSGNVLKLQRVQNSLARVVTYTKRCEHIHPVLHQLHWLPINYRINYKVATTLAYKVRSTGSPAYLLKSVSDYAPTRNLRSSSQYLLNMPAARTQTARRAFSHAAASVRNDLPADIRRSESFGRFRIAIRTHYFRLAFIN